MSIVIAVCLPNEVVSIPNTFLDIALHINLFAVAVLSIVLPLAYVVEAAVDHTPIPMPLVIFELPFVK